MRSVWFTVYENTELVPGVFRMKLSGDGSDIIKPGQFIDIGIEGFYLRRPLSVCDRDGDGLTVIYKVVGKGTEKMSRIMPGEKLNALSGLGNGFDTSRSGELPLLIGGGLGVPPMYGLCKALRGEGKRVSVLLGFNSAAEVFYEREFKELGADVYVTTADGSRGEKGFVTDVMNKINYSFFYACGPEPMFKAIEKIAESGGQYSFEERMGCGFGACMGCSCKTVSGERRICRDGPVFDREEILWQNLE